MKNGPQQNYFVRHLPEDDPRRNKGHAFQIQAVDKYGLATAFTYLGQDDEMAVINGRSVPPEVVNSAKELGPGESRFVDSCGNEMLPKDLAKTDRRGETQTP
jgi:hypothetical protein